MADRPPISFPETRQSKGEFMYLPKVYKNFQDHFPEGVQRFQAARDIHQEAGPLDEKIQNLVKLGIAVGANSRGGVMSNTRKAKAAGATAEEVRHAVLLAMTTTGFPI
jgi:4-carboxymuconolactone decarboxylase